MHEIRRRLTEIRIEGRRLSGVALRYGDTATLPWGVDERIEAGAFGDLADADVTLNVMHDRARPIARTGGGGLSIVDTASELRIVADLPETSEASDVLTMVRSRVYRGLSVEFLAKRESQLESVRVIQSARLLAVGIVDRPAYPQSTIDTMRSRAAKGPRTARRRIWL